MGWRSSGVNTVRAGVQVRLYDRKAGTFLPGSATAEYSWTGEESALSDGERPLDGSPAGIALDRAVQRAVEALVGRLEGNATEGN